MPATNRNRRVLLNPPRLEAGGASYTRTAFVSSAGNDGTAVLNNASLPYLTQNAAVNALAVAYPGLTTTLRYKTSITGHLTNSANLNTLLTAGLTMTAHDATVRIITGVVSLGDASNAILSLNDIVIEAAIKVGHVGTSAENAATITGSGGAQLTTLTVSANTTPTDGAVGTGTPNAPVQPDDSSPPTNGTNGGNFDGNGAPGNRAWNLTLVGTGVVGGLNGVGGGGGGGGNATGGDGGTGGNSNSGGTEDGAIGGNGGHATANGGNGGDGSTITKAAGWMIFGDYLPGASGGLAGSAVGGAGGFGGSGANGGAVGATGSTGNATSNAGAAGADGSIT